MENKVVPPPHKLRLSQVTREVENMSQRLFSFYVCRLFENKMKELEKELSEKSSGLSRLKQQLKEVTEREDGAQISIRQLEDQVQSG